MIFHDASKVIPHGQYPYYHRNVLIGDLVTAK